MVLAFGLIAALRFDAKSDIQWQYDIWSKAFVARDSETLIGLLSPDYSLTMAGGRIVGYDVYVARLKLMKEAPPEAEKSSVKILKCVVVGDEAEVIAVETMESRTTHPNTGKPSICYHRHEYADRWIRYDAGWRRRKTTIRKESTDIVEIKRKDAARV